MMDVSSPATLESLSKSIIRPSVLQPMKKLSKGEPMALGYIISGSLSVAVAKNPKIALVKGMLGMNVVSTVAAGVAIIMLSIAVADQDYYYTCEAYYTRSMPPEMCHEFLVIPYTQSYYISAILLVFTILEFLIALTTAAFGCASMCRNAFSETTVVIFQNAAQKAPVAVLTAVKEDEAP